MLHNYSHIYLRNTLFTTIIVILPFLLSAQIIWTSTGCTAASPKIDKVFIDACENPESQNEFLYMTIGEAAFNWSNMEITGSAVGLQFYPYVSTGPTPSLNLRPFIPSFTSNPVIVAQLNAAVGSCATPVFQVAPPILCPGDPVLVRMSSASVKATNLSNLCGRGPIYVLSGNYTGGSGFFRNNVPNCGGTEPCQRFATFNFGNGCVSTLEYNVATLLAPPGNSSTIGIAINSNGTQEASSDCYKIPDCTTPNPPSLSVTKIEWCDDQPMPTTKIECSNCYRCQYFIYDAPTGGNLIYSGNTGSWPNAGWVPPIGYNTYYIEQKYSFCSSSRIPVQINRKPIPVITPIAPRVFCEPNSCITLTATGTAGATYSWSPTSGVANPNSATTQICNTGNTVYTLTSILDGCVSSTFANFSTNNSLNTIGAASSNMINCINGSSTLAATPVGNNFSYNWSFGSFNATPIVTSGGNYTVTVTDNNNGCTRIATVNVPEEKGQPTLAPFAPIILTCTNGFPNIPVNATGANLTYNWSPTVFGSPTNPIVSVPGNYTLTVTNSVSGCRAIQSVNVTSNKIFPTVLIAPPAQLNCFNNGQVTLNPSGTSTGPNFTYQWTGPGGYSATTLNPPIASQGGTYTLVVTNTTNGCTELAIVNIAQNTQAPNITAGANQTLNCYNSGSVLLGITGGPSLTYQWSNGATTGTLGVNTPGTYSLTVTDNTNGCTRVSSATIASNNTPPTVAPIASVTVTCANPSPSLVVNASGGTNLAYNWTPSGNGANSPVTSGGNYAVTVVNQDNGCASSVSVTVAEDKDFPTAAIAPPDILNCYNNSSIALNTSGTSTGSIFSYLWTGPGGQSGTSLPIPSISQPGTYTLVVTNSRNGCTKSASVNVIQNITAPNALAGPNRLLNCANNGVVTIGTTNTSNYTYLWTPNNTTSGIQSITTPGVFTLLATDPANGCTVSSTVTVTEDKSVPVITDIPALTLTCGTPIQTLNPIVAGNNLTYNWSPSGIGANPAISLSGIYSLTLTDAVSGCTATQNVIVSEDKLKPTATIATPNILNCFNNSTITLDPSGTSTGTNFTYSWSGVGGFSSNSLNPPSVTLPGTYVLTVTNTTNGCTELSQVTVNQNIAIPNAIVPSPLVLNCYNNKSVTMGTSPITNYSYIWSNNVTSSSQIITQTGIYTLTITDAVNGCTTEKQVAVNEDDTPPSADAGLDISINCYSPIKQLAASAGNGSPLSYAWSGAGLVGGVSTLTPSVNQGGQYILTVTNITNGCTATSQVNVIADKVAPTAAATFANNLNCNVASTNLDANGSSVGQNYTFTWSGPNNFTNNSSLTPTISLGGNYTLVVTNTDNGCSSTKTIFVNQDITPPSSSVVPPNLLSCYFPIVNLQAATGNNPSYFYTWTSNDGNFVSGTSSYDVNVDKAGTYTLTIFNTANGCSSTSTAAVIEDRLLPQAVVAPANELTCPNPQTQLNGNGSSSGTNFTYLWTTSNGSFISGENTLFPIINQGGTYTLQVLNTINGCRETATISVVDNRIYPAILIASPPIVTCRNPSIEINATASSNGTNFIYQWTALNGGIITNGGNTLTPTVTRTGVYQLVITNTANACSTLQTVIVNQDKILPSANAGPNKLLTCTNNSVQLTGSGSIGNNFTYQWGSQAGKVQTGGATLSPIVTQAATYTLTVTNLINGCIATSDVTVSVDTNVPTANAGTKRVIDCNISQVSLDATKSDNGTNFTYSWATSNGAFVSGQNSLQPIVNKPGIYNLTVTNNTNNCNAFASVEVEDNRIKPIIVVATPLDVNCANPQITLNAKGSSSGAEFSYNWTTINGNIISGVESANLVVSKSGDYILKIKNNDNGCQKDTIINVKEFFNSPKAIIQNPAIVTCINPNVALDATASTNIQNTVFRWVLRNNANFSADANTLKPLADNAGFYKLVLRDTISQCMDSLEIEVKKDANIPNADAGPSMELNCKVKEITIQATASASPTITYEWTTQGGNILSGSNSLSPKIDKPGDYTLKVSNSANQCVKFAKVTIAQDTAKPVIITLPTSSLNCKTTVVKIDAAASSTGAKFKPQWIDPQNGIISGNTSLTPLVNKAGLYTLNLSNTSNFCVSSSAITIVQNIIKPIADAKVTDTVTCRLPKITMQGLVSAASGQFQFEWRTNNGNFQADKNTLQPVVDKGGIYQLFVKDTINFCESNTQIIVYENTITPLTNAGDDANLTCKALEIDLNGTVQNSDTKDLIYTWTTQGGNILNGKNTINIRVDAPGLYILKIENRTNGCFTIDSTRVTQDANVPNVSILGDVTLDCKTTSYVLDGSNSTQGIDINFEWKTSNGANILSGANTLKPIINGGGIYTLTIFNTTNNCVKSISKTIAIDTVRAAIEIQKDILTCKNTEVELKASIAQISNYSINWTSPNPILGQNTTPFIRVNTKGIYQIDVQNLDNFCTATKQVEVQQDTVKPIANAGPKLQPICNDTAYIINALNSSKGNNYTYTWSSQDGLVLAAENSLTPKVKPQATYKLLVVNTINGCEATDTTRILNIKPKLNAATIQHPLCHGGVGTIFFNGVSSGTPPFLYSINNGITYSQTVFFDKLRPSFYNLKVQDANGCEDSTQVQVIEPPLLTITIPAFTKIDIGDDAQFEAVVSPDTMKLISIQWSPDDSLSCKNCLNPIIKRPFRGGTFTLLVENDKGCIASAATQLNINRNVKVYAPTAFSPNGDQINDFFTLFGSTKAFLKINYLRVFDRWGTLVFERYELNPNNENEGWDGTFRGDVLNPAVFVWYAEILRIDGKKELIKGDVYLER
jgi:gliding motility-associated-like protein